LNSQKLLTKLKELHHQEAYDSLAQLSGQHLGILNRADHQDSLLYATLMYYQCLGRFYTAKDFDYLTSLDKVIASCPQSESGDSLRAVLYNKKAYTQSLQGSNIKSYKSISKSIKLLESLSNPNPGYLMGGYLLMSTNNAYFGNFEQARYNMRLAEYVYAKNKQEIDQNTWEINQNNHRLGVIAKYRKIYMLWKSSRNSKDSLVLIEAMKDLEEMHRQPNFHKEERIYYSTALNHVGDWLVSHKTDSLVSEKEVAAGLSYLLKSLYLIEKKGYPGTPWSLKYNIAKAFALGNQLEKADSTISVLFRELSPTDGRLPFFLAQKGLIKAKKQEKDSALLYFHKSIEKIHQGDRILLSNYRNFKPSKKYNHTRLLLRIHEELDRYYGKDSVLRKKIEQLPYMALQQFENSYLDVNFNSQQNKQLREIIQGILKTQRTGFIEEQLPQKTLLNKFEIFKSQLSWKKFYENRYTNSLPALDSIKQRQTQLASLLTKAKIEQNLTLEDSISNLINQHQQYKKERFPRLELLSNFQFSVEKLQKELAPNELVLKYILLKDEVAIYQISKTGFTVKTLPWTSDKKQSLTNFIQTTRDLKYNPELAAQLGSLLLPKVDQKTTHLIINPDGALFALPFEILQVKGNFLAQNYNIRYTSNLGFIPYAPDANVASEKIHIYAPKYKPTQAQSDLRDGTFVLLGASEEAETISKLFPSKVFNDETLTKSKFIATSNQANVLHLAMHAEVNRDHSGLSRLLFSSNLDKEDEHLYLEELYGLSLSADLVILSACNTGTGLEKNGNVESFQRAFTFAGVPATVASLWEVPDTSTKEIMVLFYQNLQEGQSKSEALRNAKLRYQKNHEGSRLAAPYFWAGFVVYGSDTPISEKPFSPFTFLLIAMIATPILWYRRRKLKKQPIA
jgi:CHAT domain-containing protein